MRDKGPEGRGLERRCGGAPGARAASVATLLHTGAAALAIHALRQSPAGDAMLRRFGLHAPPVWDTAVGGARNRHAFSGAGRTLAGSAPLASELDL